MLLLSEYRFLEKISVNGGDSIIYRAERYADNEKVLLKILENAEAVKKQMALSKKEFDIANDFTAKGIACYSALETYPDRLVLVIKDKDGISFEKYLQDYRFNIDHFLKIAIALTEILEYFFLKGVIHQSLSPARFLVNPSTLEVYLIDCSDISRVSGQTGAIEEPEFLKGGLAYISPEQTGRIKGEVDIRSNLYSLGVMLYELATGQLPFVETELLTLVHCHIAKNPRSPDIVNSDVPEIFSKIILKLLSKTSNHRYSSPFGLRTDLETCLNQWETKQNIGLFELGRQDFSGRLQKPQQFFGREKEVDKLLQAFQRVHAGNVETLFIEGYSGIGKSALVSNMIDAPQVKSGIFIKGKFNQFQRNVPYMGFIQAFKEFTNYILANQIDKIDEWREKILKAVGSNARVLTDLVPHLQLLIGSHPPVPELEPNEIQNRFNYVFVNFIKCISRKEHPLIIFLDDLQWSDVASLNLLKNIAADKEVQALLFIGAYRDNEITGGSFFSNAAEEMEKDGCIVEKLVLSALSYSNTEKIIRETLGNNNLQNEQALVSLVFDKSQGNPFFINAFLKCLFVENILVFDFKSYRWNWDITKMAQLKVTDNIVDLMNGRIRKLPEATQRALKVAACLGYYIDVYLLCIVLQQEEEEIIKKLKPAIDEGFILPSGTNYHFAHDRIQQAIYSLISESEKEVEHLRIGRSLLRKLDIDSRQDYVFEIVNQLNAGIGAIINKEEIDQLATLNLAAGIKAKASAAYEPSFEYLQIGISLLSAESWKTQYAFVLQLYNEGAESAFLSGNHDIMEKWVEQVIQNGATIIDKVSAYEILIKFHISQHKQFEAVQLALHTLRLLNVHFPKNPSRLHVLLYLARIRLVLLKRGNKQLEDMPFVKSPEVEAANRILASVGSAVYFTLPDLFPLLVLKGFSLMIENGHTPYSGIVCTSFGMILLGGIGDIKGGYKWGKKAVQMSEKFDSSSIKCQSRMMANTFFLHWLEHLKNTLQPLVTNYWYGLENGNIEFATYSALVYCYNAFFCGRNLKALTDESGKFYERFQRLRHVSALHLHTISYQATLNLFEEVENPTVLTGRVHNENEMVNFYTETKGEKGLFKIYLYKLLLSYLFGKMDEAATNAVLAKSRLSTVSGSPEVVIFYFFETLAHLSLPEHSSSAEKKVALRKVLPNLKVFKRFASLAPMNSLHKYLLLKAEYYRVYGKSERAAWLYDEAITKAKENEYINDQALICERASLFYKQHQRELFSKQYMIEACSLYRQWGAFNKVRSLETNYPFLKEKQEYESNVNTLYLANETGKIAPSHFSSASNSKKLDLESMLRASTAISSEIQLEKLLKKLVKISVENAGAQRGYLILKKENDFFIEAEGSIDQEEEVIVHSIPLRGNSFISEAIVQFVYVTQEFLVIENAIEDANFSSDAIIQKNGSKSILCTPIIHHGVVIGLLYFEHKLISNAFTPDRIELLKLLSGQMAISLQIAINENKRMNAYLEQERLVKKINLHEQELLKTKLEIQEQTYLNISEEIHDNIGQVLGVININLNTIDLHSSREAKDKLDESSKLINKAIKDLRDLSKSLNSDFIETLGLPNAIDQQLQLLKKTGLYSVGFLVKGDRIDFESQLELVVFRIVQELMNNIVKHAQASTIDIVMEYYSGKLIITVSDNGRGFDVKKQELEGQKGLGLRNIQNRIRLIGGSITFNSDHEHGTTAVIEILKEQEAQANS